MRVRSCKSTLSGLRPDGLATTTRAKDPLPLAVFRFGFFARGVIAGPLAGRSPADASTSHLCNLCNLWTA